MEFIVVFGGESWEHEISIVSAITLKKELKNIAHFVFIDSENDAYLIPREMMKSTHFSSLAYKKDAKLTFTKGGFLQSGFLKKNILRGIVINLIHGKSGEDGQMAGILDFYQIDFVGPRIEACAVSFSKEMTKIYAEACGVRVLEYCIVDSRVGNSSLDLHSADFANLGRLAQTSSLALRPKFAKNHESQTENPSVVDSANLSNSQNLNQNNSVRSTQTRPLRGAKNREQGCSSASADFLLEAEKRGSPPKSEKAAAFWRVGGAGRGVQPFLRKESSENNSNENAESSLDSVDSAILSQNGLPRRFCESARNDDSFLDSAPKSKFATFPYIIKPAHLGSSIGIAVAKNKDDLAYALDCAFEFDERAIIEPFIPHIREFNLAGCKINGEFVFSMIEEVKKDEFFGFEDKYLDFQGTQKKQAADLSQDLQEAIKANFIKIYDACFEGALIRCDFFLLNDEIYLNEINPIPGSLAHYLFDDFNGVLQNLAQNLPKRRKIPVKYQYISKIQAQKGK